MITYEINGVLYINITNKCTNNCNFCIRTSPEGIGYNLWLVREPSVEELLDEIGNADGFEEVVFCGYGEPFARLFDMLEIAKHLKKLNKKVRIDTNGQGDLIWGRSTAPFLEGLIDTLSISLNAPDAAAYEKLCRPDFGEEAFDSIINFIKEAKKYVPHVYLTVVNIISAHEIERCKEIADSLGLEIKVRKYYK